MSRKGENDGEAPVKYVAVRDQLIKRIGGLAPGSQLPSEAELCAEYEVSRITLRRAVEELVRSGMLERIQGRGTFVVENKVGRYREAIAEHVVGFYRQQTAAGRDVSTTVLGNTVVRETAAASMLGLDEDEDLIQLDRVRRVDGVLHQYSRTWLRANRFPRVLAQDWQSGSLYEFLEAAYGVGLVRNDLVVTVARATGRVAEALQAPEGEPILSLSSTVFSSAEGAVAHGITHFAPDCSEMFISVTDVGPAS